ncbi:MAG: methyltransferase domain-containing protein [Thermoplasmata archaeon]|nr:MAG: methyltransferase domain-containing protein [Thermoplasmata archaeon]
MVEIDHKKAKDIWDGQINKHGDSFKALAYGSKETQNRKFQILIEVGDLQNKSILDVGCGFGDLYDFLSKKGIEVEYYGVDISSKMIDIAKKKKPQLNFEASDILEMEEKEKYDYVLSTGFNCFKTGNNEILERLMIKKMFDLCRIGVAVGLQSKYYPDFDPNGPGYASPPEELFEYCMKEVTRWVLLRHDYMPHDFTLYLYRKASI